VTAKNEAAVSVRRSPDQNLGFRQLLVLDGPSSTWRLCVLDQSLTFPCLPGFDASTSRLRTCPTLFEVSLAPDLDQFGSGAIERPLKVHLLAL
jgi:hypothetical protein